MEDDAEDEQGQSKEHLHSTDEKSLHTYRLKNLNIETPTFIVRQKVCRYKASHSRTNDGDRFLIAIFWLPQHVLLRSLNPS